MPIRSIINFKDAIDLVVGVNIKLLADGGTECSYCVLKRKGDHVSLLDKKEGIREVSDLYSDLQPLIVKGVRVHVNCVGRSVLNKTVEGSGLDSLQILQQWFPGIRKDDFVFQHFMKKNFAALSLIRAEDVQRANVFLNNGVTSFSLGICITETIASIITEKSVIVEGVRAEFDDHQITSLDPSQEVTTSSFAFGNDVVPASCLLSYASAMIFFLPLNDLVTEGLPSTVSQAAQRYDAKRQIYSVGKWMMIALLVVLPINLVLNFWLGGAVASLEASLLFHQGRNKSSQQNTSTTQKINAAYSALGYTVNRLPLYYSDQVCATLPSEIQLQKLEVGLLDENILRKDRYYKFDVSQIKVRGVCNDPIIVNNWISDLAKVEWVKNIGEQKYYFDVRLGKGVFEFIILIKP